VYFVGKIVFFVCDLISLIPLIGHSRC